MEESIEQGPKGKHGCLKSMAFGTVLFVGAGVLLWPHIQSAREAVSSRHLVDTGAPVAGRAVVNPWCTNRWSYCRNQASG